MSDLDVLTSVLNLEELAKLREQIGAVWEALLDDVAGEYDDPAEAIQRAIHFRQKQIGAVWEALPDDVAGQYDEPAEAIQRAIHFRDTRIAALTDELAERTDAAKVRGFALGRTDILDRIAEALDQIGEPAPEVRGILATLRTDRTWQR